MDKVDYVFKVILIGNASVGKSCLLLRFCDNTFNESYYSTIGVDFKIKTITLENSKVVKLQIYDTAGQERFHTITSSYYHAADGIGIVYDVTRQDSFDSINSWLSDVEKLAKPDAMKILIGNKCDLTETKIISQDQGFDIAKAFGIPFIETSAKTSENVDNLFYQMAVEMVKRKEQRKFNEPKNESIDLHGKPVNGSSSSCGC